MYVCIISMHLYNTSAVYIRTFTYLGYVVFSDIFVDRFTYNVELIISSTIKINCRTKMLTFLYKKKLSHTIRFFVNKQSVTKPVKQITFSK